MSPSYRLTSGAESDVRKILEYTLERWGSKQAPKYPSCWKTPSKNSPPASSMDADFQPTCLMFGFTGANTTIFSSSPGTSLCLFSQFFTKAWI